MLKAVVYVSEAAVTFDEAQLRELQRDAAARNASRGVTGYLWFGNGRFVQYLEGAHPDIESIFSSIKRDPRHEVIAWTGDEAVTQRRFPSWNMRRLRPEHLVEIRLEHLLSEHLLLTRCLDPGDADWERLSWRLVSAIASLQGELNRIDERSVRTGKG